VNHCTLVGRLTRDPELKYTPSGLPVATFGIAVDRITKDAEGKSEVDFFNIVAWRQKAEFVSQYVTKGARVGIEGRIQIRKYVAQDGTKRSVTEIVADNIESYQQRQDGEQAAKPAGDAPVDDFADPFAEEN